MNDFDSVLKKETRFRNVYVAAGSFGLALFIMLFLYKLRGYAPFGNNSLACMDANIDYLDFFCYLRDILTNDRGLIYSFSKGLGGNMFGVITSGYFSPVNLLVLLFNKNEMENFFDIAVAIKIALSAATMSWFLCHRTADLRRSLVVALSIGYGMCQYNLAQASNVFFLEGSYMLPLFMLGVYYIVEKERPFTLMFSVAYLVTFNWYVGAINCFFTIVWSVFEFFWHGTKATINIKRFFLTLRQLVVAGFGGVLISGAIFFPTVVALRKSSEGSFWWGVFNNSNEFFGNIVTIITNYHIGSISYEYKVSLFCGSLALIGCIAFFFSSRFSFIQKCVAGLAVGFIAVSYYWKPIALLYSMLKYPISFWCRYSYLGVFAITFFAALFFEDTQNKNDFIKSITASSLLYAMIVLVYNNNMKGDELKRVYIELFCFLVVTLIMCAYASIENKKMKVCSMVMLIGFISFEMGCNAILLMNKYHQDDIQAMFIDYVNQGEAQIGAIKQMDNGYYRISQTRTRNMQEGNLTANYDDAHMLNYWGVASYTSVPDDLQREFLDRSGYHINGEDMYIVNTSIIPVDSLLGVKYILSDREITGLEKVNTIDMMNDKYVYHNPYSLPMIFTMKRPDYEGPLNYPTIETTAGWSSNLNPFLYQNDIYSMLSGSDSNVFIPLEYEKNIESSNKVDYLIKVPEGEYSVYGNLPWNDATEEKISVNGEFITEYARWLSPSVFYIPAAGDEAEVTVESKKGVSVDAEQFYAVDLKKLKEITEPLQSRGISDCIIEDGHVEVNVDNEDDEVLFTTIQYDPLWTVTINGEVTAPEVFGNTFMMVPLNKGNNHIVFDYKLGGLRLGILSTVAGLLIAMMELLLIRHKMNK